MGKVSSKERLPNVTVPPIVCVCCHSQYKERVEYCHPKDLTSSPHEALGEIKDTESNKST